MIKNNKIVYIIINKNQTLSKKFKTLKPKKINES